MATPSLGLDNTQPRKWRKHHVWRPVVLGTANYWDPAMLKCRDCGIGPFLYSKVEQGGLGACSWPVTP